MNTMQAKGYKAEKGNESTSKGIGAPKYQLTKKKNPRLQRCLGDPIIQLHNPYKVPNTEK